jgi:arylamine N-acetyltransferase
MSVHTEALSMDVLERVLSRLGLADRPAPTLDGFHTLYAAWCRKVPFDNVRKLIHVHHHGRGRLPGDDATDFFEAWLAYGTGGTCWAGNGALHALLVSLGFDASRGMGTMRADPKLDFLHSRGIAQRICQALKEHTRDVHHIGFGLGCCNMALTPYASAHQGNGVRKGCALCAIPSCATPRHPLGAE